MIKNINYRHTTSSSSSILSAFLLLIFLLMLPNPTLANERVYLDITQAQIQKLPFAIPPFQSATAPNQLQKAGQEMADYLGNALQFHGFITILPKAAKITSQEHDWHSIGANYAILGTYDVTPDGISLELRLLDAYKNYMEFGRRYSGKTADYKPILLKFCDEVIQKLTGDLGISSSKIAFVSNQTGNKEIYLADVLGDEIRRVTRHNSIALSPRFSPDASQLAYTSYHKGNPNLYITDLSQDKTTMLISRRKGLNMAPSWAPDAKSMVMTLSKDGNPDLYLIDTSGKILKRLTNGEGINVSPSFSPDGKQIAFVSDRSGSPQIHVMNLNDNSVKRITYNGVYNTTPEWSPKGNLIAFSSKDEGYFQIFTITPDGKNLTKITKNQADHESPSWSPDGHQIAFSQRDKKTQKIYTIFSNGSGQRMLFNNIKGEQSMPQWSTRNQL